MSMTSTLMRALLPACCTSSSTPDEAAGFQALLDARHIGVLSAACCDATAAGKDEALQANLQQAMAAERDTRPVVMQNITSAQRHLRALGADTPAPQRQLVDSVVSLFQSHGLAVFPLLIVDGRVAFYGGAPSVELIRAKLRAQARIAAGQGS
jgi:hypothetical protein